MIQNVLCFLEKSAEAHPRKTAFADEHTSLTYGELTDLSMKIGSVLGRKTGPRRPVPVLAEKNVFTLGAFLGIVQAGWIPCRQTLSAIIRSACRVSRMRFRRWAGWIPCRQT